MKIFENIINHKINTITGDELLKYGNQFQVSITKAQANQIAAYLRGKKVNIFNESERAKLIKEIANITSPGIAKEVNRILLSFK